MDIVAIDKITKKIVSLKDEIIKLEFERNSIYKNEGDKWLNKYATDGYSKYYIYTIDESCATGFSCETIKVYKDHTYNIYRVDSSSSEFFHFDDLTEITKEEFVNEFEECVKMIRTDLEK